MEKLRSETTWLLREFIVPLIVGISIPILLGIGHRLSTLESDIAVIKGHVEIHDSNAQEWKDRIVKLESFKNVGDRFTSADGEKLESKITILDDRIDSIYNRLWRIEQRIRRNEN